MIRMKVNIEWIKFSIHEDKVKVKYKIEIGVNNHNDKPS